MKNKKLNTISIQEMNENLNCVFDKVDACGEVVIIKDGQPKYILSAIHEECETIDDETLLSVANGIMKKNSRAFKELAK